MVNYYTTSRPELDVLMKKLQHGEFHIEDISTGVLKLPYYSNDLQVHLGNMSARLNETENLAGTLSRQLQMCFRETEALRNETKSIKKKAANITRNVLHINNSEKKQTSEDSLRRTGFVEWLNENIGKGKYPTAM